MDLGQFDPANIADSVTGGWWSTIKGWFAPVTMIIGGLVAFGFLTKDKADSLGDTLMGWLSGAKDWAMSFIDGGEGANVKKGLAAQLDRASSFASIDGMIGIKDMGTKIRDLCKEAATEGGDPIDSAIALHGKIHALVLSSLKDKTPKWSPQTDLPRFKAQADAIAFQVTGLQSTSKDDVNPNTLTSGYVGMLLKTQTAKEAEGTLQESEVAPISINTAALQQAVRAAASGLSEVNTGSTTPPPTNRKAPGAQL